MHMKSFTVQLLLFSVACFFPASADEPASGPEQKIEHDESTPESKTELPQPRLKPFIGVRVAPEVNGRGMYITSIIPGRQQIAFSKLEWWSTLSITLTSRRSLVLESNLKSAIQSKRD